MAARAVRLYMEGMATTHWSSSGSHNRHPMAQGLDDLDGALIMIQRNVHNSALGHGSEADLQETQLRPANVNQQSTAQPLLTIFAIPKPFTGHTATIQSNAIRSWARLLPTVQLVLFGDESDQVFVDLAIETGATLIPIEFEEGCAPQLDTVFDRIHKCAEGQLLMYSNADVIYSPELLDVAGRLIACEHENFLAIGQRTELVVSSSIDFSDSGQWQGLREQAEQDGQLASMVCKEFFLFSRDMYREVPAFRVGRGNWDNWMVWHAHQSGVVVVDVTSRLMALHQNHEYGHLAGGRRAAYVTGADARHNQKLAGGQHMLVGSRSTWELTETGVQRKRHPLLRRAADIPRFIRLLRDLMFLGYFWVTVPLQL